MQNQKYTLTINLTQGEYDALVEAVMKYRKDMENHLDKAKDYNEDLCRRNVKDAQTLERKLDDVKFT